jgi:predicted permease
MTLKIVLSVLTLFLMMLPGVIMKKCKMSGESFGKGLSNLVLFIASPALIFEAYLREFNTEIFKTALIIFLATVLTHTFFSLVAFRFFSKDGDAVRRVLRFSVIFANAGYMGIPLIEFALGGEAVIYASIYNIGFNIFQWSLGVRIFEKEGSLNLKKTAVKVITHPCTLAAALGILFFVTPMDAYIPEVLRDAVVMLKNLVAPLSMIVIGLRLAEIDLSSLISTLKSKSVWLAISLRHFILPIAVFGILRLLSLVLPINDTAILIVTILASTPVATATTMFSERYDGDAKFASRMVSISTLLSIVTMPLIILLTEL